MVLSRENPLRRPVAVIAAMLSLSIGWGIRGNYGHEYGAMMPGMLCAVCVCLFSGREDWRRRVPFFALFGALGWAFGGSMSYMPTMSYAQSGDLGTELYGFLVVFAIGFLWTSMGAAGTAYAAVEDRERLTALFRPLCWVFAFWLLQALLERAAATSDFRQRNPFYWFDSSWQAALFALLGLGAFDLWDRRGEKIGQLAAFGGAGALAGFAIERALRALGWMDPLLAMVTHPQGDTSAFPAGDLMSNWPQVFFELGPHMGWIFGLALGLALYFYRYGKWRGGSSLLLHITVGGTLMFLAGPVLLSNVFGGVGGFRMVPPRGDNWAFVLGGLLGLLRYMRKNGLEAVWAASWIGGIIGGLGFMLAEFVKILAFMPGNPLLTQDPAVQAAWRHWRGANWHSIVAEQGVGLLYGLAIVAAMGLVLERTKPAAEEARPRRWTEFFCVVFILNWLVYVNLVKNVGDWTALRAGGFRSVPLFLKAPLFGSIELSALGWYNLVFAAYTLCVVALLAAHARRPLEIVPASWTGRGQLFYLLFLWMVAVGNFEKALVAFREQRLATEGVITVNALIATFLVLALVPRPGPVPFVALPWRPLVRKAWLAGVLLVVLGTAGFTAVERAVYGGRHDGFGGHNLRFGPQADWRVHPLLKSRPHN